MINENKKKLYDEDIERFMPMLGTVSDKYLQKLQKMNDKRSNFVIHIVAMLIGNDKLHEWTTTDLLGKSKRLIREFKRSDHFKYASGELKKFINDDFTKGMNYIKIIAIDLERLGFKNFWLKEKLPVLKKRIAEYQSLMTVFNIEDHVNGWVAKKSFRCSNWYVLSFSGHRFELLLEDFGVVSPIISSDHLFERVVTCVLKNQNYKGFMRKFKPNSILKAEFKAHPNRSMYRKLNVYVEACLKMAMKVYLMENVPGAVEILLPEGFEFANDILKYLKENEKISSLPTSQYIGDMMVEFSK